MKHQLLRSFPRGSLNLFLFFLTLKTRTANNYEQKETEKSQTLCPTPAIPVLKIQSQKNQELKASLS